MTRLALGIEYDGSAFCGWQTQVGQRTVQDQVEQALSKVANEPVRLICAGRTDTAVHATGQVAHFDTRANRRKRSWILGTNANLPDDVNITWVKEVADDFHARFSATGRSYRYIILNRPTRSALQRRRAHWTFHPLALEAMQTAARKFIGEHDFSSFRAVACQAKSPVRTIEFLQVQREGDYLYIDIRANAFLHHMVRNIAGVLLAIGEGKQSADWVDYLLEVRDRRVSGVTAPPQGLYFVNARYPAEFAIPEAGFHPKLA